MDVLSRLETTTLPLLSIVIPIYNSEKFLRKCLDSILRQTYTNIEVIMINDGSSDNSGLIINQYQHADNRFKALHIENQGQANARNMGISLSKGDYITFIDSDDYLGSDTTIEENMFILNQNQNIEILQYPTYLATSTIIKPLYTYQSKEILGNEKIVYDWFSGVDNINYCIWNKIYKSSVLQDIRFPKGVIFEDIFFCSDLMKTINCFYISNKGQYCHFVNEESITRSKNNAHTLKVDSILSSVYILKDLPKYSSLQIKRIEYFLNLLRSYLETTTEHKSELKETENLIYDLEPTIYQSLKYLGHKQNKYSLQLIIIKTIGIKNYSRLYKYLINNKS